MAPEQLRRAVRRAPLEAEARRIARMRRLGRMAQLAPESLVVDVGSEPVDAAGWARIFGCRTVAVQDDADAVAALEREADETGLGELLAPRRGEPGSSELPGIGEGEVALLQAHGLADALGFERAAAGLRGLLAFDGILVLYARSWLRERVPEPVRSFWSSRSAGEIRTVKGTLALLPALGFEPICCELVSAAAWDEHYAQSEARLAALASGAAPSTPMGRALEALRDEIRIHHEAGGRAASTIGCFVGRRLEPNSPPRWPRRGASE